MLRKTLSISAFVLLALVGFQACFTKPDFPFQPSITFGGIVQESVIDTFSGATLVDTLLITVNFRDGDGDLGLSSTGADTQAPFQEFLDTMQTPNFFFHNYHISIERKGTNGYEDFELPDGATLNGRFPRILGEGERNPVEGTITLKLAPVLSEFDLNDTIRFNIFIIDRALNISNTVTTDSVIINRAF